MHNLSILEFPDLCISGVTYCNPSHNQASPNNVHNITQWVPTESAMDMLIFWPVFHGTLSSLNLTGPLEVRERQGMLPC